MQGDIIKRAHEAGSLAALCLKLTEDLEFWAEKDSIRDVQPRIANKENPELHRQEIVKHEECLHAIDESKIQGK
jgi:hypothetical protein